MKKDLIVFSNDIVNTSDWDFIEREFPESLTRKQTKDILMGISNCRFTPEEDMVRLYEEGVTYQELGTLFGRKMQSVARSIKTFGNLDTSKNHRHRRKEWVIVMKKYYTVHLADLNGGYEWLVERYGVDMAKAKDMYRRAGGKLQITKSKKEWKESNEQIDELLKEGYTVGEIAKMLNMPKTTVYYRINSHIKREM